MNYPEIKRIIDESNNVFIMGHDGIDLDAFGACLGMFYLLIKCNHPSYIIIDEEESNASITKTKEEMKNRNINIKTYKYEEIKNIINNNSLLIILDVNKEILLQNNKLIKQIKNIIIFDHHKESVDKIKNFKYKYINTNYSSTCEIVINLLKYFDVTIPSFIASIMLGGITIDTNNFTLKTNEYTYENASYLVKNGADTKEVQYLLKENLEEYFDIQRIIQNVIIINKSYAICVCDNKIYDKEFLAKIATTLLSFNEIEISFSIGQIDNDIIGISSRSLGNVDASVYMKKLGGGGHITDAACQIKDKNLEEVKEMLLNIIKEGYNESNIY